MHPFATYVLKSYYKATGWNEDNLYANLTRSSSAILDFTVPKGLHLSVSKSPNALFRTTYSMNAMPSLNGSVGYIFSSCDLDTKNSGNVRIKEMIERFKVYDQPRRPEGKEQEFLAGENVTSRDYLMYGRLYLPTGRLDALYSTRLSATIQGLVAVISDPPTTREPYTRRGNTSNMMFHLQHDAGKWCTEYTYSMEDGMLGFRFLHNFGRLGVHSEPVEDPEKATPQTKGAVKRVDEEDAIEGGLRGRVSVGAELYFSALERSAGMSTGIRFTTLPDATPPSFQLPNSSSSPFISSSSSGPSQPPTTITALFNPMLGHMSGAYTARVSRDLSLSSRFDFNVYSFESEWTMGAEWWLRRSNSQRQSERTDSVSVDYPPILDTREDVNGVVKTRASSTGDVALMWEGRVKNMLISLGIVSDFASRSKPIKSVGLELSYFSSN
ncbi:mitochondrial distribution and morphology protein 10 [Pluteus cervinus]|uniref:Mitochondrial distribution and morphology protein 10 n=1 Tax=Pluteus cervinus TaxID=181527 RepID=A0ACD3BES2_9AGAR|nr:mitochondrial distribution and morphology protein 10 [Pluteus cervinus]